MIRSALTKRLNRMLWLQTVFVTVPIWIIVIYISALMFDVVGVAKVIAFNNRVAEEQLRIGELKEVSYFELASEGRVARAIIGGDETVEETVVSGESIFVVQSLGAESYRLQTKSGAMLYMERCSLFQASEDEDGVEVDWEGASAKFSYGDLICSVSVSDEGLYRVTFLVDGLPHYDLDSLCMLELVSQSGGSYTVKVSASYEVVSEDMDINFCSILPKQVLYYNEISDSFVRNLSEDYDKTFLVRANAYVVLLATIVYCALLWKLEGEKELKLLKDGYIVKANVFAVGVLTLCMITIMMLF